MASNEGGGKRRLSKKEQEIVWISSQDTLDAIARLSGHDYEEATHPLLLGLAKYTRDGPHNWDSFFRHIGAAKVVLEDAETNRVLDDSHLCYAQWRLQSKPVSHQWKRYLILNLGLNFRPYSVKGAIKQGLSSFKLPCGVMLQLVRRDPTERPKFLSYHHMYDLPGDHMREGGKVVNEENGFLMVQEHESVLFYSGEPSSFTEEKIELVVIRGVAFPQQRSAQEEYKRSIQDSSDSDVFYQWLLDMILYAINVRKNTRPPDPRVRDGHEGSMTQFGISEGSRSARQIGYAKSYKTKLTYNEYRAHDEDANAAGGIFWSLAHSSMPTEVIDPVVQKLQENHIPHLASNFVAAGKGYRLQLGEAEVIFPEASRAPPELYLTRGYSAWSHKDRCYAPWAFNLNVAREHNSMAATANTVPIPSYGGANFVDVDLCVVIVNARATMFAFKPTHVHGTTVTGGTTNFNLTFGFSQRITDALAELEDCSVFGTSTWGAGEGNLDDGHLRT